MTSKGIFVILRKMKRPAESKSLSGDRPVKVYRQGDVIVKDATPWTPAIHALLRHLESVGFAAAPRLVGDGIDKNGREVYHYIESEIIERESWSIEAAFAIGRMLHDLHKATESFQLPEGMSWKPWFARKLGGESRVIGHCDLAFWNIIARNSMPVALIDWEYAGPIDPIIELAQACWYNAKLFDDSLIEEDNLPPIAERAKLLRAMVDGYGLAKEARRSFVDSIIEYAVHDAVEQVDEAGVTSTTTDLRIEELGYNPLWSIAWRARSAA